MRAGLTGCLSFFLFRFRVLCAVFLVGALSDFQVFAQDELPSSEDSLFYEENNEPLDETQRFIFYPWNLPKLDDATWQEGSGRIRNEMLSLRDVKDRGRALYGLVQGNLLRDDFEDALIDTYRIEDLGWLARALIRVSTYLVDEGQSDRARLILEDAIQSLEQTEDEGQTTEPLLRTSAILLGMNEISRALEIMDKIPDPLVRIVSLRQAANRALALTREATELLEEEGVESDFSQELLDAKLALYSSLRFAVETPYDDQQVGLIALELIEALIDVEEYDRATEALGIFAPKVLEGPDSGRDENLAFLAGSYIRANDAGSAMEMVRLIPDADKRAWALASVARARGDIGDTEAMTPLFFLAREEISRILNNEQRLESQRHLMRQLTAVGRLADAFEIAGEIADEAIRAEALSDMAMQLLDQEQYAEARTLISYIPPITLRLPIISRLASAADSRQDPQQATDLLINALDVREIDLEAESLSDLFHLILTIQAVFGDESRDDEIFSRIRTLVNQLPNNIPKVASLLRLAVAEAETEQLRVARQSANAAYRVTFDFSMDARFPRALEIVSYGQLLSGDLLSAFDTAARTPLPPTPEQIEEMQESISRRSDRFRQLPLPADDSLPMQTARYAALARVAATAARIGEMDIALRAVWLSDLPGANASALAAVAVGLASQESTLEEILVEAAEITGFTDHMRIDYPAILRDERMGLGRVN